MYIQSFTTVPVVEIRCLMDECYVLYLQIVRFYLRRQTCQQICWSSRSKSTKIYNQTWKKVRGANYRFISFYHFITQETISTTSRACDSPCQCKIAVCVIWMMSNRSNNKMQKTNQATFTNMTHIIHGHVIYTINLNEDIHLRYLRFSKWSPYDAYFGTNG